MSISEKKSGNFLRKINAPNSFNKRRDFPEFPVEVCVRRVIPNPQIQISFSHTHTQANANNSTTLIIGKFLLHFKVSFIEPSARSVVH
jgi:hypothetical protein